MKNFVLGGAISGNNALKSQETGWEVIDDGKGDNQTTWDDLKDVAHDQFNLTDNIIEVNCGFWRIFVAKMA